MPALVDTTTLSISRRMHKSSQSTESTGSASSTGAQKRPELPKAIRSRSFAAVAHPILSMDNANVESPSNDTKTKGSKDATSIMTEISNRSQPTSPHETPVGAMSLRPASLSDIRKLGSFSSSSSSQSLDEELSASQATIVDDSELSIPAATTAISDVEDRNSPPEPGNHRPASVQSMARSLNLDKRQSFPTIGAAAAVAKKWGWNAITRNTQQGKTVRDGNEAGREGSPAHPIGRGRPLPPPGQPLPRPDRRNVTPVAIPKRKPLPPPLLPERPQKKTTALRQPAPPLPQRLSGIHMSDKIVEDEGVLVVEAPPDSEPTSPLDESYGEFVDNVNTDEEQGDSTHLPSCISNTDSDQGNCSSSPRARSSHQLDMYDDSETPELPRSN